MAYSQHFFRLPLIIAGVAALSLTSCGGVESEAKYPTGADRSETGDNIYKEPDSIFGEGGIAGAIGIGGGNDDESRTGAAGLAINAHLWRASLETVSFLPLISADPFGGVVITDWYTPKETDTSRFKINVFILDRQLRTDALQVRVFKQESQNGQWVDAPVSPDMARQLENTILTRAREMRVAQMRRADSQ